MSKPHDRLIDSIYDYENYVAASLVAYGDNVPFGFAEGQVNFLDRMTNHLADIKKILMKAAIGDDVSEIVQNMSVHGRTLDDIPDPHSFIEDSDEESENEAKSNESLNVSTGASPDEFNVYRNQDESISSRYFSARSSLDPSPVVSRPASAVPPTKPVSSMSFRDHNVSCMSHNLSVTQASIACDLSFPGGPPASAGRPTTAPKTPVEFELIARSMKLLRLEKSPGSEAVTGSAPVKPVVGRNPFQALENLHFSTENV